MVSSFVSEKAERMRLDAGRVIGLVVGRRWTTSLQSVYFWTETQVVKLFLKARERKVDIWSTPPPKFNGPSRNKKLVLDNQQ